MAEGSIHKRCSCKDPQGRKLHGRCPQLHRPGGGWHPTHGWWAYQLELPPTAQGSRRQLRRSGFPTRDSAAADRDHAQALLNLAGDDPTLAAQIGDLLAPIRSGKPLPDTDKVARRIRAGVPAAAHTLTGDYLQQWYDGRRTIQATTARSYAGHLRNYLIPHLGHIPIDQLRIGHIQAMFDAITDRNTRIDLARQSDDPQLRASVKGTRIVSPATMHRIRATLRKALNDAIRAHRLIDFNPAAHIELPSGKRPKAKIWTNPAVTAWRSTGERPSPVMVWTPQQAGRFLDHAETHDPDLYPMFALILHRGLRRGEAVGLPDRNVNLDAGTITISQQITTLGYEPITKAVKSDAGERSIPLGTTVQTVLRAYRARRNQWQLAAGHDWPTTGLFFVKPDGQPWHPELISDRFEHLVTNSGLPPIRLHDLRHCAATYLKAAGADLKTIQETLGHSSITITADTYTSVIQELEAEQAKADAATNLVPRTQRRAS